MLPPGTSVSSTILTIEVGRRTAWLHGERVPALLRRAGVTRKSWDAIHRCWAIPVNRVWDVLPVAEKVQRREVNLVEVNR